jgi:hypothetical protein
MEETAKKLMGACSEESAKYENFPPALLKLRESLLQQAVNTASQTAQAGANLISDVGGALFGEGMKPKPTGNAPKPATGGAAPFVDFSWESQDYICNILYDRFVLPSISLARKVFSNEVSAGHSAATPSQSASSSATPSQPAPKPSANVSPLPNSAITRIKSASSTTSRPRSSPAGRVWKAVPRVGNRRRRWAVRDN